MCELNSVKKKFIFLAVAAAIILQQGIAPDNHFDTPLSAIEVSASYSERYVVTDYTKANDTSSDTQAIQKLLDKNKSGNRNDIEIYFPAGKYYLDDALRVYSNTHIVLANGARIINNNRHQYMIVNGIDDNGSAYAYNRSHNISIEGGVWDGNAADTTKPYGVIKMWNAKNITIKNTTFTNYCGTHCGLFNAVSDCTFDNVTFSDFKEYTGLPSLYQALTGAAYNYTIAEALHLDYLHNDLGGSNDMPCRNVTVKNCTFKNCVSGVGTHHYYEDEPFLRSNNIVIANNTFINCDHYCVDAFGFTNTQIYGNSATNAGGLVYAQGATGSIHDNYITMRSASNGTVYEHSRMSDGINGIDLEKNSSFDIYGNTLIGGSKHGIYIDDNTSGSINNNTVTSPEKSAICVKDTVLNSMNNNNLTNTGNSAVVLKNAARIVQMNNNFICNVGNSGISIDHSIINAARYNTISIAEDHGIYLTNNASAGFAENSIKNVKNNGIIADKQSSLTAYVNTISGAENAFYLSNVSSGNIYSNIISNISNYVLKAANHTAGVKFTNNSANKNSYSISSDSSVNLSIPKTVTPIKANNFTVSNLYTYTGSQIKPAVKSNLKPNTDYTVSYGQNVKPGKGTVTIKGIGKYSGSITYTFYIRCKRQTINSLKASSEKIMVQWKKDDLASGYQLSYSTNSSFANDKKYCFAAYSNYAGIGNIKQGTTYYLRVRSYSKKDGTTIFGQWSNIGKVTIPKVEVKQIRKNYFAIDNTFTYTGSQIKPKVKSSLRPGIDYTVSYGTNVNVGQGTVMVKGKGKYKGSLTYSFNIRCKKQSVSSLTYSNGTLTAQWGKDASASGYQFAIADNGAFNSARVYNVRSANIGLAKAGNKAYYVKVRSYSSINGKTVYGKWSDIKAVYAR